VTKRGGISLGGAATEILDGKGEHDLYRRSLRGCGERKIIAANSNPASLLRRRKNGRQEQSAKAN